MKKNMNNLRKRNCDVDDWLGLASIVIFVRKMITVTSAHPNKFSHEAIVVLPKNEPILTLYASTVSILYYSSAKYPSYFASIYL